MSVYQRVVRGVVVSYHPFLCASAYCIAIKTQYTAVNILKTVVPCFYCAVQVDCVTVTVNCSSELFTTMETTTKKRYHHVRT